MLHSQDWTTSKSGARNSIRCPTWVEGIQLLQTSSDASQGASAGSQIIIRGAGTPARTPIWNVGMGITGSGLTYCAVTPAPPNILLSSSDCSRIMKCGQSTYLFFLQLATLSFTHLNFPRANVSVMWKDLNKDLHWIMTVIKMKTLEYYIEWYGTNLLRIWKLVLSNSMFVGCLYVPVKLLSLSFVR